MKSLADYLLAVASVGSILLTTSMGGPHVKKQTHGDIRGLLVGTWRATDMPAAKGVPVILAFDGKGKVCEWGIAAEQRASPASYAFDPFHRKGGVAYQIDMTRTPAVLVMLQKDILGDAVTQEFEVVRITEHAMVLRKFARS